MPPPTHEWAQRESGIVKAVVAAKGIFGPSVSSGEKGIFLGKLAGTGELGFASPASAASALATRLPSSVANNEMFGFEARELRRR